MSPKLAVEVREIRKAAIIRLHVRWHAVADPP